MQEKNFPVLNTQSARIASRLAKCLERRQEIAERSSLLDGRITQPFETYWTDEDAQALADYETWYSQQIGLQEVKNELDPTR